MVKRKDNQTRWAVGLLIVGLFMDFIFALDITTLTDYLAGAKSNYQSFALSDIGSLSNLDPLLGFILGLGFFASAAHFAIYSRPKAYWYAMIAPAILLSLVGWKFLLIELGYIAAGIILGTIIRKLGALRPAKVK